MANNNNEPPPPDEAYEQVGDRVRIFQRGKFWYANFQHAGRQHRESLKTSSKKEARRRALQIETKLETGRWDPEIKASSIDEAIEAYMNYLRAEGRAKKTLGKYTHVLARVKNLAELRHCASMEGLDLKFLDAYRRQRVDDDAAPKTIYNESTIIRQLINFALTRGMLVKDAMKGAKLKKPKPTQQPCWTFEQLQEILAASPGDVQPAFALLAETGMRFGELQWLTWDDIDLKSNILRIRPKDGWKPKSGDERAVPISKAAKTVLEGLPQRWRWVVTMPPSPTVSQAGRQWTERRLLSALKRVLKTLKLPGKLHTYRHTFISNALLKNMPVAVVQEWVGHVDPEIIKLYTHVHNEASQAAMQRLSDVNHLQQSKETGNEKRKTSAQNQHRGKESESVDDAK